MKRTKNEYLELADQHLDELIKDLCGWIKIDSVFDPLTATASMPFGKGVDNALKYAAELGKKCGFEVDECEGYCTELTYGVGKEIIMIMGHGDVVPVGNGWDDHPFLGEVRDNHIYGRGSWDDKGPTLAAFHALNILKNEGRLNKNKTYKVVIGGNEERGSACLAHYFNKLNKPAPTMGFTPDAEFPLVYGEKGIFSYIYQGKDNDPLIKSLKSGIAANAVPDHAKIILTKKVNLENEFKEFLAKYQLKGKYDEVNDETILEVFGKGAHASTPKVGVNALTFLIEFLGNHLENQVFKHFGPLFKDCYGKDIGLNFNGPKMGDLTMNVGIGEYQDGNYFFVLNIRYPIDTTGEKVKEVLDLHILHQGKLLGDSKPLYVNPDSKFIQTLLTAYQDITGDLETKPMTIGGGTYARNTINSVAFGMGFPDSVEMAHQANECLNINDLRKGFAIYLEALESLGDL